MEVISGGGGEETAGTVVQKVVDIMYKPKETVLQWDKSSVLTAFSSHEGLKNKYRELLEKAEKERSSQGITGIEGIYNDISGVINRGLDKYQDKLLKLCEFSHGKPQAADDDMLPLFIKDEMRKLFPNEEQKDIVDGAVEFATLIAQEIENLLRDTTNCWLKFYSIELWKFVELGVNEFSIFQLYVYEKIKRISASKIQRNDFNMIVRLKAFLKRAVQNVGISIFEIAIDVIEKMKNFLEDLNTKVEKVGFLTPYVSQYLLTLLAEQLRKKHIKYQQDVYLLAIADDNTLDYFFHTVYDNLENNPTIDYDYRPDHKNLPGTPVRKFSRQSTKLVLDLPQEKGIDNSDDLNVNFVQIDKVIEFKPQH